MSAAAPRRVFDADGHVIEPPGLYFDELDPAFRDRLEESTYAARQKRGAQGSAAVAPSSTPRAQPVTVSGAAQQGTEATTQPLQPATVEPAPQQGFQPVSEGEIRTESLDDGS